MKKHYRKENDCLNCGTILEGKFCHVCGQENLELRESFGHMMNHAISDYFHFDHQFFHTLKPLLFKPGYLTNEYMAGRRVQYLHPIKMYIFISIVYFLLLFQTGSEQKKAADLKNPKATEVIDSVNKAVDKDTTISDSEKKIIHKQIEMVGPVRVTTTGKDRITITWFHTSTADTSYEQYLRNQKKLPEAKQDGWFRRQLNRKVYNYREKYGTSAEEIFVEDFKHNISKMMFVLLPLFALILKIAFWRNKKYYVEHLIYSFHLHCFLFLFLSVIILLKLIFPQSWGISGWVSLVAMLYVIWYLYRSFRVVYHRSRFRSITKVIGVSFMYLCAFTLCITLYTIATIAI